jgi:phage tail sheath protein FI
MKPFIYWFAILCLAIVILAILCSKQPAKQAYVKPLPEMVFLRSEDTSGNVFVRITTTNQTVKTYDETYNDCDAVFWIENLKELEHYRKQLEFALTNLEEIEKPMKIKEKF